MNTEIQQRLMQLCKEASLSGLLEMVRRAETNRELYLLSQIADNQQRTANLPFEFKTELLKDPTVKALVE